MELFGSLPEKPVGRGHMRDLSRILHYSRIEVTEGIAWYVVSTRSVLLDKKCIRTIIFEFQHPAPCYRPRSWTKRSSNDACVAGMLRKVNSYRSLLVYLDLCRHFKPYREISIGTGASTTLMEATIVMPQPQSN